MKKALKYIYCTTKEGAKEVGVVLLALLCGALALCLYVLCYLVLPLAAVGMIIQAFSSHNYWFLAAGIASGLVSLFLFGFLSKHEKKDPRGYIL